MTRRFLWLLFLLVGILLPARAQASPRFYIFNTDNKAVVGAPKTLSLYLDTDSQTINTVQTVIGFNTSYITIPSSGLNVLSSRCSFWSPANPGIGDGSTTTPYVYNNNQVIFACGFSSPNYFTSTDSVGKLVLKITFLPSQVGTTTLSFSNTKLWSGAGVQSSSSASLNYDLAIYASTASAYGWVTPAPTPTPTPQVTITGSDLIFVEVGSGDGSSTVTSTSSEDVTLQALEEDNTIPAPPANLEKRPSATPYVLSLTQPGQSTQADGATSPQGEVLAVQSLRELLIPGQSQADKTVVLVNLISILTFIIILVIVLWRLVMIQKTNKLKSLHMKDVITSEISMLQSKMAVTQDEAGREKIRQELDTAIKKISKT